MKLKEITSHLAEYYYHRHKDMKEPDDEKRDWALAENDIQSALKGSDVALDSLRETLSRDDFEWIERYLRIRHNAKQVAHLLKEKGCKINCPVILLYDEFFKDMEVLINQ